jgi:hypothetical protein
VLADAARDLIAKIATAVPERLRPFIAESPTIGAPPGAVATVDGGLSPGPAYPRDLRTRWKRYLESERGVRLS